MKNTILVLAGIVSAMFIAQSCADERGNADLQGDAELVPISITLSIDEGTKATLGASNEVLWEADDSICVCYPYSGYRMSLFKLTDGAGTCTATFSGYVRPSYKGSFCCFYPYSASSGRSWDVGGHYYVGLSLPKVQKYRPDSFAREANIAMVTVPNDKISEGMSMYNVGGILQLVVKGTKKIRRIELENYDGFVCGENIALCEDFGTSPSEWSVSNEGTASSTLTLDCGESGVQLTEEGVEFNMVVPSERLSKGFSVTLYDTDGDLMAKSAPASKQNGVERSGILRMPAFEYAPLPHFVSCIDEPGIYANPFGSLTQELSFLDNGCQCGFAGQDFFVQNWAESYAVSYTVPTALIPGNTYDLNISKQYGTPAASLTSVVGAKFYATCKGMNIFVSSDESKVYAFYTK